MNQITFIGSGVMGSALAGAAVQGVDPREVVITDIDAQKAAAKAKALGCRYETDNAQAVQGARFVVFCIKPHLLYDELMRLAPVFQQNSRAGKEQVVVTVVPAVTAETYREALGVPGLPVIRMVPNTACTVGKGLTLIMEDDSYTAGQLEDIQRILAASGAFDTLPPAQYIAGAVLASTAPAFISMVAAALEDSGVIVGLGRDKSRRYALECLVSTGQMLLENGRHMESVKEDVCSPAGAGIQGVRAFELAGGRSAVIEAILATDARYRALGDIKK